MVLNIFKFNYLITLSSFLLIVFLKVNNAYSASARRSPDNVIEKLFRKQPCCVT